MTRFIKKNWTGIAISVIFFLGVILRFYQLGNNPPSLDWDEVSLGYNAYSILQTGKDEYGTFLPLSIRSFDDYKPPLYVYLTIPSVFAFGLTEFAVRLPSAILGCLAVVLMYFLVKELLIMWSPKTREYIALVSAFFLAVSPWQLQFSRAAFEGNIGLFFLMGGLLFFLVGLRKNYFLFFSSVFFVLSLYSYHSYRMLVPLLIFLLSVIFYKKLQKYKKVSLSALLLLLILSVPIYANFVQSSQGSGSRLSMVTIFSLPELLNTSIDRIEYDREINYPIGEVFDNRRVIYFLAAAGGYLDHFNPDFLFVEGDGGVQHHPVDFGMLYLWDIPFLLVGLYMLVSRRDKYVGVILLLLVLSPVPASITTGTPHPVRAITMLLPIHIIVSVGLVFTLLKLKKLKNNVLYYGIVLVIFFAFILNFSYYLHQYYVHTPREYGYFWQYGHKEAVLYAKENEDKYDRIIFTYAYDQPYIYYLFHNKIDPAVYQQIWDYNGNGEVDRFRRVIGKYEFRNINYARDSHQEKTLLIGTPDEIPDNAPILREIHFPDGKVAFQIVGI